MFAITQKDFGGPETLVWDKVADPRPQPGEVIIDITSTAVNRADLLQREGNYPPPTGATDILGLECAGTIVSVGAALTLNRIGERVTALLNGGGYAQKVAIPLGQVMSVPEGVSVLDAGALPEVACTVWSNLTKVLQLREASTILIHGGGSMTSTAEKPLPKSSELKLRSRRAAKKNSIRVHPLVQTYLLITRKKTSLT